MRNLLLLLMFVVTPCLAQGRLPPADTDPATYGDVRIVGDQVIDEYNGRLAADNATNAQVSKLQDDYDKLIEPKAIINGEVRVWDGKHFQVAAFNEYDVSNNREFTYGVHLTLKLGRSYEQRELDKLKTTVDVLMKQIQTIQGGPK
jgi:hypothetical protein